MKKGMTSKYHHMYKTTIYTNYVAIDPKYFFYPITNHLVQFILTRLITNLYYVISNVDKIRFCQNFKNVRINSAD